MALLTQLLRPQDLELLDQRQVAILVGSVQAEIAANQAIHKLLKSRVDRTFKELSAGASKGKSPSK
jgi:hypothetical protein